MAPSWKHNSISTFWYQTYRPACLRAPEQTRTSCYLLVSFYASTVCMERLALTLIERFQLLIRKTKWSTSLHGTDRSHVSSHVHQPDMASNQTSKSYKADWNTRILAKWWHIPLSFLLPPLLYIMIVKLSSPLKPVETITLPCADPFPGLIQTLETWGSKVLDLSTVRTAQCYDIPCVPANPLHQVLISKDFAEPGN